MTRKFGLYHGVVIVAEGDNILYHEGFSYKDALFPTNKHAQYFIASITKQFTAVALLKALYDIQAVDALHKPISIWFDDLPNHVTLHHLLTHTSGIKKLADSLEFKPGTTYDYANVGYTLLGMVIQKITQKPLDEYFEAVLFAPAQMHDTGLPLSGSPIDLQLMPKFQKLALGFANNKNLSDRLYFDKPSTSGGVIATAEDLVKWNHALYGGKIIPKFLVEIMCSKYVTKESYPYFDGFEKLGYGYGLDIYEEGDKKYYQHCGGITGYQSKIFYNSSNNITIVMLSNTYEEKPPIFEFVNKKILMSIKSFTNECAKNFMVNC